MKIEIREITPDGAREILATNYSGNRAVRVRTVEMYASDMAAGRWQLTGAPIQVSASGNLIDGQHRLHAVIKSGIPVPFAVATGVPDGAYDHLDIGMSRNVQDVVKARGGVIGRSEIGAARLVHFGVISDIHSSLRPSKVLSADIALKYHDLIRSVAPKTSVHGLRCSAAMGALALASFYEPMEEVLRFSEVLASGVTSEARDRTVIGLRDWLLASRRALARESFGKACRAIQAFCDGQALLVLKAPQKPVYEPRVTADQRR